jgi:histidine ammonia-lyase
MDTVTITDAPTTLEDLLAVARGARVELGQGARDRIAASRAVVDEVLATGRAVYGLTTGVGHTRDDRVPDEELRRMQRALIETHASGYGPPLPAVEVRAAMMARLAGLARGGSGASQAVADVLAAMLNARVHPVVPSVGSVGAGDLGMLACIGQVAIGTGRAELDGDVLPGRSALTRAGIEPITLEPKDGLALMSANGVSISRAALVIDAASRAAAAADLATAVTMEATGANPSVVQPAVGLAKPYPGQIAAGAGILAALQGSALLGDDAAPSVQDALSIRVAPQVNGALRELIGFTADATTTELNAQADNPLTWVPDATMLSNGNFHPMVMAVALDALRVAVAHTAQISERRLNHLWAAIFTRMGTAMPAGPLWGMALRYPATAAMTALRSIAGPATLDSSIIDMGIEDHATGAPLAATRTAEAVALLGDILAAELLLARDALSVGPPVRLGAGTTAAVALADEAIAAAGPEASSADVHRELRARFPA